MPQHVIDRYHGKPFLKLLDSYVLKAIGHLDRNTEDGWNMMLPKLQNTFDSDGSWIEIVEQQMEFPASLSAEIRRIWDEGCERFEAATGQKPDPVEFTYEFVDTNFPTHTLN